MATEAIRTSASERLPGVRGPRHAPLWRHLGLALGLVAGWRAALWLFALLAAGLIRDIYPPATAADFFGRALLQGEALWHVWIGQRGYEFVTGAPSTAAFPPLFALLLSGVAAITGSTTWAGVLVAHAALVAALVYLAALARLDADEEMTLRTVAAALLWPAAPFLGAVYPESLLLLTVTAALYHARRGQWWAAGAWGALAGLTRAAGLLVLVPLLIEWAMQRPRDHLRALVPLVLVPVPFLAFLAYLWNRTGVARAFVLAQEALGQGGLIHPLGLLTIADARAILARSAPLVRGYPAQGLAFPTIRVHALIDLGALALGAALGLWLLLRVRPSYGAFVLAGVAATALVGGLPGAPRHLLALAPIYLALGYWTARPVPAYLAATLGLFLSALTMFLFVNGFWAG